MLSDTQCWNAILARDRTLRRRVRKAELARRLKISRGNIDRLFDLHHSTRLELLEAAFAVLGRRLLIGVEMAA